MAEIDTLISNARAYADSASSAVIVWVEKLGQLEDLINKLTFVDSLPEWDYTKISNDAFTALNTVVSQKPQKPSNLGIFTINEPPDFEPIDPSLLRERIREVIAIVTLLPDRIAEAVALFNAINNKILYDLQSGGYGIDPSDEIALWERSRDRVYEVMEMELGEAREHHSTYGIPIPQGAYNKSLDKAVDKAGDSLADLNKDISIKRADLYRTAREFAISKGIELATAQLGFVKLKVETLRDSITAELDLIKTEVEMNKELLSVYGYKLEKLTETQKLLANIYGTDITAWAARLNALTHTYGVLQQANTDQYNSDRNIEAQEINRAKTQIDAFNAESVVRTAAMGNIAQVFAHKVTGALSALNTLIAQIEQTEITP